MDIPGIEGNEKIVTDEIEKAKQEAYNKIVETQINSLHKKSKLTTPTIEKNIESQQQLSLF